MPHEQLPITCPNCGYTATDNYCAHCGQETHLHSDTFWGLIMHFTGHYFHYDSKFWKTLKALWFSPGKLTIAYIQKKRASYILPASLYIFISFVFFFVASLIPDKKIATASVNQPPTLSATASKQGASRSLVFSKKPSPIHSLRESFDKTDNILAEENEKSKEAAELINHMFPKIFFFLIPLMGFVLYLLFYKKRKDFSYVSHVIYTMHCHSLGFSILFLTLFYPGAGIGYNICMSVAVLAIGIYFIVAMRNVYNIGWVRAVLYSAVLAVSYLVFLILALVAIVELLSLKFH